MSRCSGSRNHASLVLLLVLAVVLLKPANAYPHDYILKDLDDLRYVRPSITCNNRYLAV